MFSHYVKGALPMGDAFTGTKYSAVVKLKYYGAAEFIVFRGGGALGTSTLTIEACSDISATQVSPIEFTFRRISPGDTHSAPASAVSVTTASSGNDIYVLKIRASALGHLGWDYARLKSVEQTVGMVAGAILIRLEEPRYGQQAAFTAITMEEAMQAEQTKTSPEPRESRA